MTTSRLLYKSLGVQLFRQKTDHTCGPAVLKTFLHHYNLDKGWNEEELAKVEARLGKIE